MHQNPGDSGPIRPSPPRAPSRPLARQGVTGASLLLAVLALSGRSVLAGDFAERQARSARVVAARAEKTETVRALFAAALVPYPPARLFLRAFKREQVLELWAGPKTGSLTLVKTFPVCARSGTLGPKRRLGDLQVPEGAYRIDRFNATSNFYLSLGVDYPNASDRILGTPGRLGGDIFIHGDCVTIGCLPITDDLIKELDEEEEK